jgi:ATP-dependent Clp protease ATP-binding subunit ClpB
MTSNMGSEIIRENFGNLDETNIEGVIESTKNQVFELLKRSMRPEFLNRIDELVMFKPLTRDNLEGILRIQIQNLDTQLSRQNISIELSEQSIDLLIREGFDMQYGARPLKRVLQKKILDALSISILEGKVTAGMKLMVDVEDGKIAFNLHQNH